MCFVFLKFVAIIRRKYSVNTVPCIPQALGYSSSARHPVSSPLPRKLSGSIKRKSKRKQKNKQKNAPSSTIRVFRRDISLGQRLIQRTSNTKNKYIAQRDMKNKRRILIKKMKNKKIRTNEVEAFYSFFFCFVFVLKLLTRIE